MFVHLTPYVNTAHVDSSLLYVENCHLHLKDKKCLAIGIMTGTVTESFLLSSCEAGPHNSPYQIHKLTIALLDQDMRHNVLLWGQLFQFYVVAGMITPLSFSFATCGEGKVTLGETVCSFNLSMISILISSLSVGTLFSVKGQVVCPKVCLVIFREWV